MAVRSWAQAGKLLLTQNFRAPKNVCIRLKPVFGITMVYSHNIWGQRGIHCTRPVFAGHSKWKNIQHRKGAQDLKRMRVSMRLSKELMSAAKNGGPDPESNPRLASVIEQARDANIPKENILHAISKATGKGSAADAHEVRYEMYGYEGVGIVVDLLSDNRNRVSQDIRLLSSKCGLPIAAPNSVLFNFEFKGVIHIEKENLVASEDEVMAVALESGADDMLSAESQYTIYTDPHQLDAVRKKIRESGILKSNSATDKDKANVSMSTQLEYIPKTTVAVGEEAAQQNEELLERIWDIQDVVAVYHNMEESSHT
eukprot:GILK01011580.1.p1 GENE.GILK01011580.1~~GILK01011580.1.p1  ORF type:complete len:313 (-),score=69.15 GILK01011580.1:247-1185(-)